MQMKVTNYDEKAVTRDAVFGSFNILKRDARVCICLYHYMAIYVEREDVNDIS